MTEPSSTAIYCVNHPDRETGLRCHRCDRPICYQCAIKTPVGQICPDCYKAAQAKYYNGTSTDVVIGAVIALVLGLVFGALAYMFLGLIGFFSFIIAFFVGPAAGGAVAEVIRRVLRRRRAQGLKIAAALGFIVGLLAVGFFLFGVPRMFLRLDVMLFAALAASTIYARLL
ncbi:MAG: B-box zinc finger protein [Nitrososphaerales archaeon]